MEKPPPILMADVTTAAVASRRAVVSGRSPPPMSSIPPTAVRPEMAFVTLMRGECSDAVTPQTVWYPQIDARPKLVSIELNEVPAAPDEHVGRLRKHAPSMIHGSTWQEGRIATKAQPSERAQASAHLERSSQMRGWRRRHPTWSVRSQALPPWDLSALPWLVLPAGVAAPLARAAGAPASGGFHSAALWTGERRRPSHPCRTACRGLHARAAEQTIDWGSLQGQRKLEA
jgi:hypothetical protein